MKKRSCGALQHTVPSSPEPGACGFLYEFCAPYCCGSATFTFSQLQMSIFLLWAGAGPVLLRACLGQRRAYSWTVSVISPDACLQPINGGCRCTEVQCPISVFDQRGFVDQWGQEIRCLSKLVCWCCNQAGVHGYFPHSPGQELFWNDSVHCQGHLQDETCLELLCRDSCPVWLLKWSDSTGECGSAYTVLASYVDSVHIGSTNVWVPRLRWEGDKLHLPALLFLEKFPTDPCFSNTDSSQYRLK